MFICLAFSKWQPLALCVSHLVYKARSILCKGMGPRGGWREEVEGSSTVELTLVLDTTGSRKERGGVMRTVCMVWYMYVCLVETSDQDTLINRTPFAAPNAVFVYIQPRTPR